MNLNGIIARIMPQRNNLDGSPVRLTGSSSLAIAQIEGPYSDMTRSGRRFHGGTQIIANGIAPVQAIPSTAGGLSLYNNDTGGNGLVLFMDWLNVYLGSGTSAAGASILFAVAKPTTVPSANATGYATGSCGGGSRTSRAIWATGLTLPAGTVWSAVASSLIPAAANAGQGDNPLDVGGRIMVPPGQAFCLAILSGAGTAPLFAVSAQWNELEVDVE